AAAPQPVGAGAAARPAGGSAQGNAPRPAAAQPPVRPSPSAQGNMPRPAAAPAAARPAAGSLQAPPPGPARHASLQPTYQPLLESLSLAARAHHHQVRKDEKTPYVSHVFRSELIIRHVFCIDDPHTLMAAALHDTLEDTPTDWDDIHHFGEDVANNVAMLTKDKRRPEGKREEIYRSALTKAPWQVQVCKLADIFDNLMDSGHLRPDQRAKALQKARDYPPALGAELQEHARRPHEIVSQLLAEIEAVK